MILCILNDKFKLDNSFFKTLELCNSSLKIEFFITIDFGISFFKY